MSDSVCPLPGCSLPVCSLPVCSLPGYSRPVCVLPADLPARALAVICVLLTSSFLNLLPAQELQPISAPPAEMQLDSFYAKFLSADGFPIVASAQVNDYALREAAWLIRQMLAQRPDVKAAMIQGGSQLSIIAWNEFTCDIPEYRRMGRPQNDGRQIPGVAARDFWDARARGLGGSATDPVCSCGEENLLGYPGDPYRAENILIHEFAHNMHLRGLNVVDPAFDERVRNTWKEAMDAGLWAGKYASVNHHEYFAEGVQSWFSNNRQNDHDHNHVDTREELIEYDPGLAEICRSVFGDTVLVYTRPETRLHGHLQGYDPQSAPEFRWPERLQNAKQKIREQAQQRSDDAEKKPSQKQN